MVYGAWCIVYGVWCMVYGVRCMVHGAWCYTWNRFVASYFLNTEILSSAKLFDTYTREEAQRESKNQHRCRGGV
jgi:hypothetical protein